MMSCSIQPAPNCFLQDMEFYQQTAGVLEQTCRDTRSTSFSRKGRQVPIHPGSLKPGEMKYGLWLHAQKPKKVYNSHTNKTRLGMGNNGENLKIQMG